MTGIVQCPNRCGRLVRVFNGEAYNAAGVWEGMEHSCALDGANVRGDNDDDATRREELDTIDNGEEAR